MKDIAPRPLGLYVHWPYCVSKCPYCDFNSHVADRVDHDMWARAYVLELKRVYRECPDQVLSSIFFGGGTPSLMAANTVQQIIDTAQLLWGFSPDIEITLEANPTTVESHTFPDFKQAGVNRLSIGIQSLRTEALAFLGRAHDIKEAQNALSLAQRHFDRYSFDLIYARPDQSLSQWQEELREALTLSAGHLSLYQLTIEPGTPFYKENVPAADEERGADLYDLTQEIMTAHGLPAYEISNHARPGQESRHNLIYWQGDDYAGIGPGAHSRLNAHAIHQIYKPDLWLSGVFDKNSGEQKRKALKADDRAIELILMGLRITSGIELQHFEKLIGQPLAHYLDPQALKDLQELGFITLTDTHLAPTKDGFKCLNAVLEKLIA